MTALNRFKTWYNAQPRALRALLTINVVIYVVWILALMHVGLTNRFVFNHLALSPMLPDILFEPWQLITYNFLHLGGGFWGFIHILFNMLWLVWLGREYEEMHGAHQLLGVYVITGVGGGLLTIALALLAPGFFGAAFVYGASASVLGVATAIAITYPYKKIGLFLLGPIRLLYLVIGFLVLDVFFLIGGDSGTAVGAHLGGALFGLIVARTEQAGVDLTGWAHIFFGDGQRGRSRSGSKKSLLDRLEDWLSTRGPRITTEEEDDASPEKSGGGSMFQRMRGRRESEGGGSAIEDEVDRILEKISEQGMDALTDEERRILQEASRR
ncbi:MAG: rhomboid family intramembrane serine protease [Bacteroidetes bacterium]|jgi:membrane associated rhomboid family serine protease|nr:rhomboid family intramembrane serine protease [Bacteroidota bacterium]